MRYALNASVEGKLLQVSIEIEGEKWSQNETENFDEELLDRFNINIHKTTLFT